MKQLSSFEIKDNKNNVFSLELSCDFDVPKLIPYVFIACDEHIPVQLCLADIKKLIVSFENMINLLKYQAGLK